MNAGELEDFLHLPLSPLAVTQLLQVAEDLLTLPASDEKRYLDLHLGLLFLLYL